MIKILLFGGTGLVGSRIHTLLSDKYNIIAPGRNEVNLASKEQALHSIKKLKPDKVIYAAGVTRPDEAETNQEYAFYLNAKVPGMLAEAAGSYSTPFIYLSTDAVFKGDKADGFYSEDDKVDPVNYYGITKQKGEEFVLRAAANNCILRLITVYSHVPTERIDIVRATLRAFRDGEVVDGIVDQYFNPTYVDDVVYVIEKIVSQDIKGVLHFGAADAMSNHVFIKTIASTFGFSDKKIRETRFEDFYKERKAKKGQYSRLSTKKAQGLFGADNVPEIADGLRRFWQNIQS